MEGSDRLTVVVEGRLTRPLGMGLDLGAVNRVEPLLDLGMVRGVMLGREGVPRVIVEPRKLEPLL